ENKRALQAKTSEELLGGSGQQLREVDLRTGPPLTSGMPSRWAVTSHEFAETRWVKPNPWVHISTSSTTCALAGASTTAVLEDSGEELLGGFGLQRALVLDVGDPHRRQRRQQRRDDGEHQHLGPDAAEPQQTQEFQSAIPFAGCHKIHVAEVIARCRTVTLRG